MVNGKICPTCKYRAIVEGRYEDFPNLDKALTYIRKNWNGRTSCAEIRLFSHNNNCLVNWEEEC